MNNWLHSRVNAPALPGLSPASYTFSVRLFERFPDWKKLAFAEPIDDGAFNSIIVEIPSPTSTPGMPMVLWMENHSVPSLAWGPTTTYGTDLEQSRDTAGWEIAIVDLATEITRDHLVLVREAGSVFEEDWGLWDIRDRKNLAERIAREFDSKRIEIRSWTSNLDGEMGLDDFEWS